MSSLAEFHDELRTVARDVLAPTSPLVAGGEPVTADWRTLADAGWPGLEVPEQHGGARASFAEVAVVLEELGRAATASPYLGTLLAVGAVRLVEPSPARDELLVGIAGGEVVAAAALPTGDVDGVDGPPPFRVERAGGRARLVGRAPFVPDAPSAARILVLASDPASDPAGGPVLVDVAPGAGVAVEATPVVDATRSLGEVVGDGTPVDGARCWRFAGDPQDLLARGAVAVALDSVGIAQAALDATVGYASARHQFGRPIGSFQAVKHACADVAVELTIARRLVADAVDRLVAGAPDAGVAASMAKAHAVETAVTAAGTAVQLHGGIGYTWEHGLHWYLKRATLDRSLFGSPAAHRARLARRWSAPARHERPQAGSLTTGGRVCVHELTGNGRCAMRRVVTATGVSGVVVAALLVSAAAAAAAPADGSCWGQASALFAQEGHMGEHASDFETPRAGLRNLARSLYETSVLEDDSMQALGAFVADAEGYAIEACE